MMTFSSIKAPNTPGRVSHLIALVSITITKITLQMNFNTPVQLPKPTESVTKHFIARYRCSAKSCGDYIPTSEKLHMMHSQLITLHLSDCSISSNMINCAGLIHGVVFVPSLVFFHIPGQIDSLLFAEGKIYLPSFRYNVPYEIRIIKAVTNYLRKKLQES